jgi:hypothetical protein
MQRGIGSGGAFAWFFQSEDIGRLFTGGPAGSFLGASLRQRR